jgi:mRNA interferase RelE/StbE
VGFGYNLFLTNQAKKELNKIKRGNPKAARAIADAFGVLVDSPAIGIPLHGDLRGRRKYRVGDYRIIYSIEKNQLVIYVLRVAHRKESYR